MRRQGYNELATRTHTQVETNLPYLLGRGWARLLHRKSGCRLPSTRDCKGTPGSQHFKLQGDTLHRTWGMQRRVPHPPPRPGRKEAGLRTQCQPEVWKGGEPIQASRAAQTSAEPASGRAEKTRRPGSAHG